ncbi:hypothetical protein K1719_035176 [Acacia pycnantha]|nr:hypothetical protein K1719_035176 [Acacia pycnantha]
MRALTKSDSTEVLLASSAPNLILDFLAFDGKCSCVSPLPSSCVSSSLSWFTCLGIRFQRKEINILHGYLMAGMWVSTLDKVVNERELDIQGMEVFWGLP